MAKSISRIVGVVTMAVSLLFILSSSTTITGFVILENVKAGSGSFVGIILFVIGALLWIAGSEERAKSKLERKAKSGHVGTWDELRRDARKLGYELEEVRTGTAVYNKDGDRVTTIPKSKRIVSGEYKSIARKLYREFRKAA